MFTDHANGGGMLCFLPLADSRIPLIARTWYLYLMPPTKRHQTKLANNLHSFFMNSLSCFQTARANRTCTNRRNGGKSKNPPSNPWGGIRVEPTRPRILEKQSLKNGGIISPRNAIESFWRTPDFFFGTQKNLPENFQHQAIRSICIKPPGEKTHKGNA